MGADVQEENDPPPRVLIAAADRGRAESLAMALAAEAGSFHADAVRGVLTVPSAPSVSRGTLVLVGVPAQAEIDRLLSTYAAWVEIDVAVGEVPA